jgi:hypothetical protein
MPSATVAAKGYQCGDFSAVLAGHSAATDLHSGSLDGKSDEVLFITRHRNLFRQTRNYTLTQVSPNIAAMANVDFMWQCTAASAADGCKMAAKMIADGPNTPDSLSLQFFHGPTVKCMETNGLAEEQGRGTDVTANSLNLVRDALTNAADSLLKSANQSDYVRDATAIINQALEDANQAAAHVHDDASAAPSSMVPNFNAAAPPSPRTNFMLYSSLNSLKSAYDGLRRVPGGDFAGFRVRVNDEIASAADILVNGIASYNANHARLAH